MDNLNDLKKLPIDKINEILDQLTPEQRELALSVLNEYQTDGESKTLSNLMLEEYEEVPVDIETFVDDPNYLGNAWHDGEGKTKLFPYWRKELKKLFPDNLTTTVNNAIFTGSRGRGKSEVASLIIAYLLHRVLCLKNPVDYFKLKPTEKLVFAFMNIKKDLAEEIGIAKFQNTLQSSPWFLAHGTLEGRTNKVWVPRKYNEREAIDIKIGSQADDVIGLPIYAAFFDEISFIKNKDVEEQKKKAIDMINTAIGGMKTRFIYGGKNPTMLILASSKRSEKSFLEEHMKKKLKSEKGNIYISDGAVWEAQPPEKFSKKRFSVAVGNKFLQSVVIKDDEDPNIYRHKGYKVIDVPVDYKAEFIDDIDRALCDYAGISSSSITKYISGQAWEEVITTRIQNPFPKDVLTIGNGPEDNEVQYYNFFDITKIDRKLITKPLFIHLDMSLTGDKTGIAGVFIKGKKPSVDPNMQDRDLFYSVAFAVSIKAPKGRQVSFEKNRQFIRWLKTKGFNIKGITSDTYQSADLQQILKAEGYPIEILSVDRVDTDKICLLKDSLIKTPSGDIKIQDLVPGQKIYAYDIESDKIVETDFNNWFNTGKTDEYYEIETEDGKIIKCTGNHLILTKRGYVRADSLLESDEIVNVT